MTDLDWVMGRPPKPPYNAYIVYDGRFLVRVPMGDFARARRLIDILGEADFENAPDPCDGDWDKYSRMSLDEFEAWYNERHDEDPEP